MTVSRRIGGMSFDIMWSSCDQALRLHHFHFWFILNWWIGWLVDWLTWIRNRTRNRTRDWMMLSRSRRWPGTRQHIHQDATGLMTLMTLTTLMKAHSGNIWRRSTDGCGGTSATNRNTPSIISWEHLQITSHQTSCDLWPTERWW